jgi:putative FmdB family regulatory protein
MPIYEYGCRSCGCHFDALQKVGEAPLVTCPECRSDSLEKDMSAPAFHLRGTGWRSPSAADKRAAAAARAPRRVGHILDSGPPHSHDDPPASSSGGGTITHTHGGHTHTHGPGDTHHHKH